MAVGVKIYGEKYRSELASSFSHHWRQTPHLEAAWHDTPGGPDDARYKPLNDPTGRVYFMRRLAELHRRLAARRVLLRPQGCDRTPRARAVLVTWTPTR